MTHTRILFQTAPLYLSEQMLDRYLLLHLACILVVIKSMRAISFLRPIIAFSMMTFVIIWRKVMKKSRFSQEINYLGR